MSYQPPPNKKPNTGLWIGGAAILLVALSAALVLLLNAQLTPAAPATAVSDSVATVVAAPSNTPQVVDTPTTAPSETATPIPELGTSNVFIEYILDASGSMTETLSDGSPKIEVAQHVLTDHMRSFRPETNIGLRVYGHRLPYQQEAASCQDIELIAPVEKGQMERIVGFLQDFTVQGMTPLAASLEQAKNDFVYDASRVNSIVMLSDGIETCGGDPCQLVEDLKAEGINFTIHVIGLDVDDATQQQLSCIAEAGDGTYHDARSQQELNAVLGAVKEDVTKDEVVVPAGMNTPTPLPSTPTPTSVIDVSRQERIAFFSSRNHRDHPDVSPNGAKPDDIYVIALDGTVEQYVAQPTEGFSGHSLTWTPDGRSVVADGSMSPRLFVVNTETLDDTRLITGPLVDTVAMGLTWSPDGSQAALTCWDPEKPSGEQQEICLLGTDLEPARLVRLTDNQAMDWMPAWSPDGSKIAYSSDFPGTGPTDIYILDLAELDASPKKITIDSQTRDVNWSPDGRWIAFVSYKPDPGTGMWSLNLVPADGSGSPKLIGSSLNLPVWSPDGRVLAFDRMTSFDEYEGIYLADSDASNARLVVPSAGRPSWSSDGTRIAFEKEGNIWIMDSDGTNQTQLTSSGFDHSPAWSFSFP